MSVGIPVEVIALRETLLDGPDHANRIISAARANVVGTRFAPSPLPAPGPIPYAAERFCGTPFRWLPDAGNATETHGVDALGHVVESTAPGPRQYFFEYTDRSIQRATLVDDVVVELASTTLHHGRPTVYVEASRESWLLEDYVYDDAGLLTLSRQRYHLVAAGIPDGVIGQRTDEYVHAADGQLAQVRTMFLDQPATISYQSRNVGCC